MRVQICKIADVKNKLSSLIDGEKIVVDTLLKISDEGLIVRHTNGHKSYIEIIEEIETEQGDLRDEFTVDTREFIRGIEGLGSAGRIKADYIEFSFNTGISTLVMTVEQYMDNTDEQGNVIEQVKVGRKRKEIKYSTDMNTLKGNIFKRVDFFKLLEYTNGDKINREFLSNAFGNIAIEKGRTVYMSSIMQNLFVYNTAYATEIPFESKEVSEEEADNIRQALSAEEAEAEINNRKRTISISGAFSNSNAKIISYILGHSKEKELYVVADNKAVNFVVDGEKEKFAISIETDVSNNMIISQFKKRKNDEYNKVCLIFIRECLEDVINSVDNEKVDKDEITFVKDDASGRWRASIKVNGEAKESGNTIVYGNINTSVDLSEVKIIISSKALSSALKQLKNQFVAFDISFQNGLRIADVNEDKWAEEYRLAREKTAEIMGDNFDSENTPTNVEELLNRREKYLETRQYLIVE